MIDNLEYYENMLRRYSATAELINRKRWKWIMQVSPKIVLDYGSGVGWFRAFRPAGVEVDTFDIANYPQTGLRHDKYDLVTLWDVIEHMQNYNPLMIEADYVALTTPILPIGKQLETWKHYKPGEHLKYYTEEKLDELFNSYGFHRLDSGYYECPPREDIWSVLYERI